ncbi:hypothetical protein MRX96_003543 [Rhipicephalus microplus]
MLASPVKSALPLDSEASSATEIVVNGIDRVCNAFSVVARTDSWVLSMYLLVLVTSQAIRYEFHERYAEVEQRVDWTYVACRKVLSRLFPGHYSTMEATALREHKHKKVPASELLEEAKAHLTVSLNDSVSIDDAAEDAMRQQLGDIDIMSVDAVKASDFLAESDEKYTQSYTKTCSSQHARAQWNTATNKSRWTPEWRTLARVQWLASFRYFESHHAIAMAAGASFLCRDFLKIYSAMSLTRWFFCPHRAGATVALAPVPVDTHVALTAAPRQRGLSFKESSSQDVEAG